jgi:hypothetical protein
MARNPVASLRPMERIDGPVRGHYLAAYTVPAPEGYYAYTKVCAVKPDSVWDAVFVVFKVGAGPFSAEEAALSGAIDKAAQELREHSEWQLLWDLGPESGDALGAAHDR